MECSRQMDERKSRSKSASQRYTWEPLAFFGETEAEKRMLSVSHDRTQTSFLLSRTNYSRDLRREFTGLDSEAAANADTRKKFITNLAISFKTPTDHFLSMCTTTLIELFDNKSIQLFR